ncbi:coiled-coil-helix-coiled-coil-helix domain-containing protein 7-like [Pomacea canaliculata]|uniref:coiled-coil-helix-coiled-coil-helix domain-containing protein 7-like n=1 Tax=Pomacea canaliculata TaxID=400727 RepID=UPI000D73AB0A|nr:coiled-coil-helix-coiled-coil-helix domain-containing protein 7-like [Pomacea canaliculata]
MSAITEKSSSNRKDHNCNHGIEKASRQLDKEKHPCITEQEMSLKCLDDNGYDRDKCNKHFQNYRNCREFWRLVVLDRKRKGVTPYLPPPQERSNIKQEYKHLIPWM